MNMSFGSKAKYLTLAALLALSIDVSGQHVSTNHTSKKDISKIVLETPKPKVDDRKFYLDTLRRTNLEQYVNIPLRDSLHPVYNTLLRSHDKNGEYYCFMFEQSGDGLHASLIKTHELLVANRAKEFSPDINKIVPAAFSKHEKRGTVYENNKIGYFLLNEALVLGEGYCYMYRVWNDVNGYTVTTWLSNNMYITTVRKNKK
jgi:hypothetical protein